MFRVYGDNILETELVKKWADHPSSKVNLKETRGTLDCPIYVFQDNIIDHEYIFQLCPGYDRWTNKPLGDSYSEKPDLVLTKITNGGAESDPILAIESCDALLAGNQSWQRFRRATDAAENDIPYIFVTPFLDWEHESSGLDLKSSRYQSAAVTLGQLSLSSYFEIPSLQVYQLTSWCDYAQKMGKPIPDDYQNFSGVSAGVEYFFSFLRFSVTSKEKFIQDQKNAISDIFQDMFKVAEKYSKYSSTYYSVHHEHPSLTSDPEMVSEKYADSVLGLDSIPPKLALHEIDLNDFKENGIYFQKRAQSKTCSDRFFGNFLSKINWKGSESKDYKVDYLQQWGINVSKDLSHSDLDETLEENFGTVPTGYKDPPSEATVIGNRKGFRNLMEDVYPSINEDILDWIYDSSIEYTTENPLFFVPLYAYKPSGDSRPDRGLLPLLFGMFPKLAKPKNVFVLIYSVHTPNNWNKLLKRGENELWNVIEKFSGALFVDKTQNGAIFEPYD